MDSTEEKDGARFSPKQTKSKTSCCVYGCNSYACKNPTVRFHPLPKPGHTFVIRKNLFNEDEKLDRHWLWKKNLKIDKNFSSNAKVCSLHFSKVDYIQGYKIHILKNSAVPSLNLPMRSNSDYLKKEKSATERRKRILTGAAKRKLKKEENCEQKSKKICTGVVNNNKNLDSIAQHVTCKADLGNSIVKTEIDDDSITIDEVDVKSLFNTEELKNQNNASVDATAGDDEVVDNNVKKVKNETDVTNISSTEKLKNQNKASVDVGVGDDEIVNYSVKIVSNGADAKNFDSAIEPLIKKNACAEAIVNYQNFFNNLVVFDKATQVNINVSSAFLKTERDLIEMTGLSFSNLELLLKIPMFVSGTSSTLAKSKLNAKDRIILTFMKLKLNLPYSTLRVLFQVATADTCRNIFLKMLDILSAFLKHAIIWPTKENVLKNIPDCLNDFTNIRAVIDVVEINIETPNNLCCQTISYSLHKNSNTIRFMIAVSPGGLITYISKPYTGRTSNEAIFENSNFIELIDKGDALMAYKGLLIDDVCLKHDVQLIRPPCLNKKKQLSKEDAVSNSKIAKARVHINKSNQHINLFKILNSRVPSHLINKIEQIFTIICAVANLSSPILSDEKLNK